MDSSNSLVDRHQLALGLKRQGRVREASELLRSVLAEEPAWEHGYTAYALACCLEDLGEFEEAEKAYKLALSNDSNNRIFVGGFASFLFLRGDIGPAFDFHLRLIGLESKESDLDAMSSTKKMLIDLGRRLGLEIEDIENQIVAIVDSQLP